MRSPLAENKRDLRLDKCCADPISVRCRSLAKSPSPFKQIDGDECSWIRQQTNEKDPAPKRKTKRFKKRRRKQKMTATAELNVSGEGGFVAVEIEYQKTGQLHHRILQAVASANAKASLSRALDPRSPAPQLIPPLPPDKR